MTFHATFAILHPKNYHTFEVKHDKNFFLPLTDYVSKSPGSTQEKRTPPPLSINARTHSHRTPVWTTQLYTDCQMGTHTPKPAKRLGVHGETNPRSLNVSLPLSASEHHCRRKDAHAMDNTNFSGIRNFHVWLDGGLNRRQNFSKQQYPRCPQNTSAGSRLP